ncbi:hypothetical protein M0P48_03785 [Candidatus Gracilibacteria bacterium]|nr:hypothetical protein [Candidatus Gracilibacteria bacterium]
MGSAESGRTEPEVFDANTGITNENFKELLSWAGVLGISSQLAGVLWEEMETVALRGRSVDVSSLTNVLMYMGIHSASRGMVYEVVHQKIMRKLQTTGEEFGEVN